MQRMVVGVAIFVFLGANLHTAETALRPPVPPKQHAAWHPSAAIPTNILSAVETLFAQGFPDPRGCEYREIEVICGSVWSREGKPVKTPGWVLPAKSGMTNRFAICWNGVIYPTVNVFELADLHLDVTNLVSGQTRGGNFADGEYGSVTFERANSTRLLLLLRLGETEAVLKSWPSKTFRNADGRGGNEDPYFEFASDWAWAMFDHIICAHMRGDETAALSTAQLLAEAQPKIETECAKRGIHRQPDYGSGFGMNQEKKEKPYLDFLSQLPEILSDLERRAKEGERVSVLKTGPDKLPDQSARVAALIRDLDLVDIQQMSQPGSVNLGGDRVVVALVKEGDAAVEPLMDCVEHDKRLTRSVGFHRNFFRQRAVLPVRSAAFVALESILQAGFQDLHSMRAYWEKYGKLPLDERCYAILKDDDAAARWGEAVDHITQPTNIITYPGSWWTTGFDVPTNKPVPMRGELLRAKHDPSISELMARRAVEIPPTNSGAYNLTAACAIGLHLARWDPPAAVPVARTLLKRCCNVLKYSDQKLGPEAASLAVVLGQSGDPHAFDDYAEWIKAANPEELESSVMDCLKPFQEFPTNQVLEAAAEIMFGLPLSRWSQYPWSMNPRLTPLDPQLMQVHAIRKWVASKLEDERVCGSIEYHADNQWDYEVNNRQNGGMGAAYPKGQEPAVGTKAELRWCDWIALSLSTQKLIPFFDPVAPTEKRDEALKKARTLLLKWPAPAQPPENLSHPSP